MPLDPKAEVGENIKEFHSGKTYAKTKKKHGKETADDQAVAVAMEAKRGKKKMKRKGKGKGKGKKPVKPAFHPGIY